MVFCLARVERLWRPGEMENFLETRCDEENFHGTWRDFLTLPENATSVPVMERW